MSITNLTNAANREVCNVHIVDYKTGEPYMDYRYANTTGLSLTSDSVAARGHGAERVTFYDPLTGEFTISAQVYPHKLLALYSDGVIDTTASYYVKETIKCATAGELPLAVTGGTVVAGTVFVYAVGDYGGTKIAGTYATNKFTATETTDITVGAEYEVGFMVARTEGVQTIVLNNKRTPKSVAIYLDTFDKDEEDNIIPKRIIIKKASVNRNPNLSYSSDGDPQTLDMSFKILEKDRDNVVEVVEITEEIQVNPASN